MSKRTILDLEGKPLVIDAEDNHCGVCRWRCGGRHDFCGVHKKWLVFQGHWVRPYACRKSENDAAKETFAHPERKVPQVGDTVWTAIDYGQGPGTPFAAKVTHREVCGFEAEASNGSGWRRDCDLGKTWWWSDPNATKG